MNQKFSSLLLAGVLMAFGSSAAFAAPDWSKVPKKDLPVIHPGVAPLEWVRSGDHSGAGGLKKGEACAGCHIDDKGKLDIDLKRLASKEMEPVGAPKTMTYPVGVQAAFDATNLYVRLTFKAPAGGADHSDKDNEVKASVMFPDDKVTIGSQIGCWAACHKDARTMPGADPKKTKYVSPGSMELMQWRSGGGGKALDGMVTDKRNMESGKAGVTAEGAKSGDTYTVTFTRKLSGGVHLVPGKAVPFGVAIHADNAGGRFHHVSFGHTIGLGVDGDVKAVKQ